MKFVHYTILLTMACTSFFFSGRVCAESLSVPYRPRLVGVDEGAVEKEIEDLISSFRLQDRPPATLGQLRRRVDRDVPRIRTLLESHGYYDAAVSAEIDPESDPVRVDFNVEPGKPYRFGRIQLRFYGAPGPDVERIRTELQAGGQAVASKVFKEQRRILALLRNRGYPFPKLEKRTVERDRERRRVHVTLEFDAGQPSVFGEVEVEGLESVSRKYIRRQLPWKPGDPYNAQQLDDFENRLLRSGLFATARISTQPAEGGSHAIPLKITVSERDKRTVRVGASYSDVGLGGKLLWEHRNLLGNGEHLETSLTGSEIEQSVNLTLTRPGFLRANQSLVIDFDGSIETPDAYDAKKLRVSSMVFRDFTQEIQLGLGTGYQYSRVEQLTSDERYGLVFFPLQTVFDYRNDELNPVSGAHVLAHTAYYQDTLASDSFLKSRGEGRHYYMLWERYRLSSALRLMLGSIDGADIQRVPADERFYAGGGGSIRGYEYQAVGPAFEGTPLGGEKLLEFSAELRLQPGPKLGYAAFVDGGTVYDGSVSGIDESLRYGAGLGVRWFTAIGPLRVDVAYPLNPDSTQVERVQFYISLGQAF